MAENKRKLADIKGGIDRYENTFLIGGKWKEITTACCGVCGKPLGGKQNRRISGKDYYGYVFKCDCGNEVELRVFEANTKGVDDGHTD